MRFRLILIVVVLLVTVLLLGLAYLFLQSERERDQLAQEITATAAMQNTIAAYSPSPTPSPTATDTPTPSATPTDTPQPSLTPTDAATQTPIPTDPPEASATPLPFEVGLQIFGGNRRQAVLKAERLSPADEVSYVLIDGGAPNDDPARIFIQPHSQASFDENSAENGATSLNIRLENPSDIFLMGGSYTDGEIEITAALSPPISLEVGSVCASVAMTSQNVTFTCYGAEGQTCAYRDENGAAISFAAGEQVLLSLDERRVIAESESIPYDLAASYHDLMRELVTVETDHCLMPYLDQDGDGFIDAEDNCPTDVGEIDGCPDSDDDGIPDNLDLCPDQFGTAALQGCPDTDGDGVPDELDLCPLLYGRAEYFGCPQRPAFDTATPTATLPVPTDLPTETPFMPEQPTPFPGGFPTPFPGEFPTPFPQPTNVNY